MNYYDLIDDISLDRPYFNRKKRTETTEIKTGEEQFKEKKNKKKNMIKGEMSI